MTVVLSNNQLLIDLLAELTTPPPCFQPGSHRLWDDPHIAPQMLRAHLDPTTDAASRQPETIDRTVAWITDTLGLEPGAHLLDLGCGPGLYCRRFADRGLRVTGVDISENSLRYAREQDARPEYIRMDYRDLDFEGVFDAAVLIYGDLCVLAPADRDTVLRAVHRALRPGGWFVCDVMTPAHHARRLVEERADWRASSGGFFRPGPHLLLERYLDYPQQSAGLAQHFVIEPEGTFTEYRLWTLYYTPETIRAALADQGFAVTALNGDLTGTPLASGSEWIGVVARRS